LVGSSTLHPILNPGTDYWLVASAPIVAPASTIDTWAVWNLSDPLAVGKHAYRIDSGDWKTIDKMGAFRVEGTVVPVPGAVLLGILGLGVAGVKLRKHA